MGEMAFFFFEPGISQIVMDFDLTEETKSTVFLLHMCGGICPFFSGISVYIMKFISWVLLQCAGGIR
uniref:Uncharacterized protein n=1 Tax=Setaria viridis TaxID=4556 RepID=A0A4U6UXD7_SETVI|nr:hypothetical protein SEVIR_4G095401v2 [Setaria viridis]